MLGSRRSTVTLAAGAFQRRGLIRYHRGHVEILNREGLESTACECYEVTQRLFDRLYQEPTPRLAVCPVLPAIGALGAV